jgi:hypothetical protein
MTDIDTDYEDSEQAHKNYNRTRQKEFYDTMVKRGYRRQHVWFSERARLLLKDLSENYSKEVVIEESLEILALVKKRIPDKSLSDSVTLNKIKKRMQASKREHENHFGEAKLIAGKRLRIAKLWINSIRTFKD